MALDRSFLDKPTSEMTTDEFKLMVLEPEKDSDHICWNCRHFKPVIKNSELPPADIIGWCKKIHWPFFWCVPEHRIVKKCYVYDPIK
jgi:hypothetical protein